MSESQTLDELNAKVIHLQSAGRYDEAETHARQALLLAERKFGADHVEVGKALNNLGLIVETQGHYAEAESLYTRSLSIREKVYGRNHRSLGTVLNNLAGVNRKQGRYGDAEANYGRSLAIREEFLGPDHVDVAQSLSNLATLYCDRGRLADAEPLRRRCIEIIEKALGSNHALLGMALSNLADLYYYLGRYADAQSLYVRALDVRIRALGSDHDMVSNTMENMARLFFEQDEYTVAERLIVRVLEIRKKALGRDHPSVGKAMGNLATLYAVQGKVSDAAELQERAVALVEKGFGPDHPDVAEQLSKLALVYEKQGHVANAEALYNRSLRISEVALGVDHVSVGVNLNNLAVLYGRHGRHVDAVLHHERALIIFEKALSQDHPSLGTVLNNLALAYSKIGKIAEASEIETRAKEIPGWQTSHIPILFATNRGRVLPASGPQFSDEQKLSTADISIGTATILAPPSEVFNRAERGAEALGQLHKAGGRQTAEHDLSLKNVELATSGQELVATIRDRLRRSARFPAQALVYVHGYNNSFEEAMRRTAKVAFDLDFDGIAVAFSWPAKQGFLGYVDDRKRARESVPFLLEALLTIDRELPEVTIHLMGHSTGCEVLMRTLVQLADQRGDQRLKLAELILAHADVAPADFLRALPKLKALGIGITSYSSSEDWAMWLSRIIRFQKARLGGKPFHAEGVDSIDITGLGCGAIAINHNVFATNPLVFGDISRLIQTGRRPPHQRTSLFKRVSTSEGTHWAYSSE